MREWRHIAGAGLVVLTVPSCLITIDESLIGKCDGGSCDGRQPSSGCPAQLAADPALAKLYPQNFVDTAYPSVKRTVVVPSGGDLQTALSTAQFGDEIVLSAGATYTGRFTLPNRTGEGWIVVRTSTPEALPPEGTRVNPTYAPALPKLLAPAGSAAIVAGEGAHHVRFVGVEIAPAPGASAQTLVTIGDGQQTTLDALPHHIVFDRVYVHGDPTLGATYGIALNGASLAVIDSYLAGFKNPTTQARAMTAWNGAGPFRIIDNYIEAAGANLDFGQPAPAIQNLVPQDIEICGNHFTKLTAWKTGYSIGPLLGVKNGQRIVIGGNVFENAFATAAIDLTPSPNNGATPSAAVSDAIIALNVVRDSGAGVWLAPGETAMGGHIALRDDVLENIAATGYNAALVQFFGGVPNVDIQHVTSLQQGSIIVTGKVDSPGLSFENNISVDNKDGVIGDGVSSATQTLDQFFSNHVFTNNVIAAGTEGSYPPGNFFPTSLNDVGFVDLANGDLHLRPDSAYHAKATDGRDPGADIDALRAATAAASH